METHLMESLPLETLLASLEAMPFGALVANSKYEIIYANQKCLDLLEVGFETIAGHRYREWAHLLTEGNPRSPFRHLYRRFRPKTIENEFIEITRGEGKPDLHLLLNKNTFYNAGEPYSLFTLQNLSGLKDVSSEQVEFQKNFGRNIRVARRVQKHLNHSVIHEVEGRKLKYRLYSNFIPCEYISGDLINTNQINRNYTSLFLGDGRGHGFASALYSGLMYSYINRLGTELANEEETLPDVVTKINQWACEDFQKGGEHYFYSGVFSLIIGDEDALEIVNAGHPYPFIAQNGRVYKVGLHGPLIGISAEARYSSKKVSLQGGETVLFYTDGLTDIQNSKGKRFGKSGVLSFFRKAVENDMQPSEIHKNLVGLALEFSEGELIRDDISILVLHTIKK